MMISIITIIIIISIIIIIIIIIIILRPEQACCLAVYDPVHFLTVCGCGDDLNKLLLALMDVLAAHFLKCPMPRGPGQLAKMWQRYRTAFAMVVDVCCYYDRTYRAQHRLMPLTAAGEHHHHHHTVIIIIIIIILSSSSSSSSCGCRRCNPRSARLSYPAQVSDAISPSSVCHLCSP
jgi:hypothetical protein